MNICCGFEQNKTHSNNKNETVMDIFLRTMEITDYKVPDVDNLGDKCALFVKTDQNKWSFNCDFRAH